MKRGYVHIKEYDLTKVIIDKLEIEVEEGFQLAQGIATLLYNGKTLIFPEYKQYKDYHRTGVVLRPFVNEHHAQYLMNMFSDIKGSYITFSYWENEHGNLTGKFRIEKSDKSREIEFYGVKTPSVLQTALLLRLLVSKESFRGYIKDILKIDRKICDK